MSFSRAFQWYHSHLDPIWPDGTFKDLIALYVQYTPQLREELIIVYTRVRPHFRFGNEIWNWSENFILLGSEKKTWFHMIHFDAKHQESEAKMKVK